MMGPLSEVAPTLVPPALLALFRSADSLLAERCQRFNLTEATLASLLASKPRNCPPPLPPTFPLPSLCCQGCEWLLEHMPDPELGSCFAPRQERTRVYLVFLLVPDDDACAVWLLCSMFVLRLSSTKYPCAQARTIPKRPQCGFVCTLHVHGLLLGVMPRL